VRFSAGPACQFKQTPSIHRLCRFVEEGAPEEPSVFSNRIPWAVVLKYLADQSLVHEAELETQMSSEISGRLKGFVLDVSGKPVGGALIEAIPGRGTPQPDIRKSAGDGSFEFEPVKPGSHFVRVTARGFMVSTQDVNVLKGQAANIVLKLEKGSCEVSGRITEDGKRPLRAEVTLLRSGIVVQKASTRENAGTYHFRYLTEGFYEIQASSICHIAQGWSGNLAGGHARVDLVLPLIEGCVTFGKCDVCGQTKQVGYCKFCHAFICPDCKHNYPERVKAMIRRHLGRRGGESSLPEGESLESIYEKELAEPATKPPCDPCP
jgi:hypothetical protein